MLSELRKRIARQRKLNQWTRGRWDWAYHLLWLLPAGAVALVVFV